MHDMRPTPGSKYELDTTISEYSRASDTVGSRTSVREALERIKSDEALGRTVNRIRMATEADQEKLKKLLPAVTWSGEFERREAAGITAHSGLVVLDYDELEPHAAVKLKRKVSASPYVLAAFISPRATGLKVLMRVKLLEGATHKAAYAECKEYAEGEGWPEIDTSGSDVCRLCFLSYDPKVYINKKAGSLKVTPREKAQQDERGVTDVDAVMDHAEKQVDLTLSDARDMLTVLDPACDYGEWMQVGMALHAQWHGEAEEDEALALWCEWSSGALGDDGAPDNWGGDAECNNKWETMGKREGGSDVTMRSVIKRAKDAGYQVATLLRKDADDALLSGDERKQVARNDARMLKEALAAISSASTISELTGDVATKITDFELFDASRETMIDAFGAKYKELSNGQKMTKRAIDEATSYNHTRAVIKDGCPEWAEGYVFCRDKDGYFMHTSTMQMTSVRSFNAAYSSKLITPVMKAQGKVHPFALPADLLTNTDLVEKVHQTRYYPGEDAIFDEQKMRMMNRWRPVDGVEVDPLLFSPEEAEAVDAWKAHLLWLLGAEHAAMLEQFLGYIVQKPGKRVRWAFLMRGSEGCGKTMIVESLMGAVMGSHNVDILDNSTLMHTTFNEWADSRQLCFVEEVFVEGRAKWDVMNVLKPAVTNDTLSIHPKGRSKYITKNVTSYIMSTNHADALPLTAWDRRYYVCATRWGDDSFIGDLGGDEKAQRYFIRLTQLAADYPDALRGWLMNVSLKGFDPHRAKMTLRKKEMIQLSKSDLQVSIEELMMHPDAPTITRAAVEVETLKAMLADRGEVPSGQGLGRILRGMGFEPVGRFEMGPFGAGRVGTVKSYWCVSGAHYEALLASKNKAYLLRNLCSKTTPSLR